jgi:hypothetical protein
VPENSPDIDEKSMGANVEMSRVIRLGIQGRSLKGTFLLYSVALVVSGSPIAFVAMLFGSTAASDATVPVTIGSCCVIGIVACLPLLRDAIFVLMQRAREFVAAVIREELHAARVEAGLKATAAERSSAKSRALMRAKTASKSSGRYRGAFSNQDVVIVGGEPLPPTSMTGSTYTIDREGKIKLVGPVGSDIVVAGPTDLSALIGTPANLQGHLEEIERMLKVQIHSGKDVTSRTLAKKLLKAEYWKRRVKKE